MAKEKLYIKGIEVATTADIEELRTGSTAEPIMITSSGITISTTNNKAVLLQAINTLLMKEDYVAEWLATDTTQTVLNLYPNNTPVIFQLGGKGYNVNRVTLTDLAKNNNYINVSFYLDGSWAADGQTTADAGMLYYCEHVEDISYQGFYISKNEYLNKDIQNIFSATDLSTQNYVSMSGVRYFNPISLYQSLTVDNEV